VALVASAPGTEVLPETDSETTVRRIPPYNVVLLNDDHHSMLFVVGVLREVFGMQMPRAVERMMEAHTTGRAVVWTGPKEVAELKVEQVRTFHERREPDLDLGPLGCEIEPAPG
jgi:ATP-dependent Clp protease adaptor protein ClpS